MKKNINTRLVFSQLGKLLYRDKIRLIIILVSSVLSYYFTLYPANKLNYIVDGINNNSINFNDIKTEILYIVLAGIALYIVYYFKEYYTFIGYDKIIRDLGYDVQRDIYRHTPIFFNRFSIGEVISRTTNDINNYIANFFGYGIFLIFDGIVYNVFISILIFNKSNFELLFVIHLPLIIQTIYLVSRRKQQQTYYNKMAETMDKITEETLENVKGIRVIRTYSLLDTVRKSFISKLKNYSSHNIEYMKRTLLYQPLNTISLALSYVLAVAYGFYLIQAGTMTIGELIAVFVVIGMLQWPYIALSELVVILVEVNEAMSRVIEITGEEPLINNNTANRDFDFKDNITFKNFCFSYDSNEVLKNINLTIPRGTTLGIVGKTGSGKTTLIKQLLRLYPIEPKSLFADGLPIENYYDYSIRNKVGYAPQEYQLFSKTIQENILFYRENLIPDIPKALKLADFQKDISIFKDGLDTLIGENGVSLSGGQKQRLGIARALLGNPDILILDDSLSAVDANTEKNIIEHIKKDRAEKTNIIVAHRISALRHADMIIVLEAGQIIDRGTHNELLKSCSWYKELDEYQNKEKTSKEFFKEVENYEK